MIQFRNCASFVLGKLSTAYKNQSRNSANFSGGHTRVCSPRKAGQEGIHVLRRNRKPVQERRAGQKGPFMNGRYLMVCRQSVSLVKKTNINESDNQMIINRNPD